LGSATYAGGNVETSSNSGSSWESSDIYPGIRCDFMFEEWGEPIGANQPPTISSVSDSPDPVTVGSAVNFSVNWSDPNSGDQTKIHLCKTNTISGQTCSGGSWCETTGWSTTSPTNCSYTTTGADVGTKNYYAFVCDDDNACSTGTSGTFTVQAACTNTAPSTPTLVSPSNGATGQSTSPTVSWNALSGTGWGTNCAGNNNTYTVYLDTSSSPTTSRGSVGSGTTSMAISGLSNGTTYYWKVRASNGALSTDSAIWSFATQGTPPTTQRYEYYNTGDDLAYSEICGNLWWKAQTFTPTTTHKITKVKLKMYKMGNLGTLNAGVRATDTNGHPTGQDLCSGTIDANTFTTDTNGQWYEIGLGGGCNLSANTKYAVVIRVPNCTYPNSVAWRFDGSSATYSSGNIEITYDGGSSWTCCASYAWDFMFEEWGEPIGANQPPTISSVSDSPDPVTVGSAVNFSVNSSL
jgi:hypothetical protein